MDTVVFKLKCNSMIFLLKNFLKARVTCLHMHFIPPPTLNSCMKPCYSRISGRVLILDALLIPAYSTIHIVFCHVLALDLIKASWQLELQLENNVQKQRKPYHENEIVQVLVFFCLCLACSSFVALHRVILHDS